VIVWKSVLTYEIFQCASSKLNVNFLNNEIIYLIKITKQFLFNSKINLEITNYSIVDCRQAAKVGMSLTFITSNWNGRTNLSLIYTDGKIQLDTIINFFFLWRKCYKIQIQKIRLFTDEWYYMKNTTNYLNQKIIQTFAISKIIELCVCNEEKQTQRI
jgi:hypothetical protein